MFDVRSSVLLAVLAFLLLPALSAQAQAPSATDPFAAMNRELSRVADSHLEQAAEVSGRLPGLLMVRGVPGPWEASATSSTLIPPENIFARVSLEQVSVARRRLQALGVDAARIFREEGVPLELLVLAGVESGYDPLALSPKGARGIWQLMPETAARFGLRVDRQTDERIHAVPATRAAARYLSELHHQFGDWHLVLAAYNAGEARIAAAIERSGTHDFWQLAGRGFLPEETCRYVPAVLARLSPE